MKKGFVRILGVLFILFAMGMTVCAVDVSDIKTNRIFQVNGDVELHEEPDTASAITSTLPKGTPVIIKEDANEGWCRVAYKENEGYMQISYLEILGSQSTPAVTENETVQGQDTQSDDGVSVPISVNALDDEFRIIQEENQLAYQEAETAKKQAKSDRMWGIVIAVLVIAIFAVGIVTTLIGNKGKKKGQ